MWTPTKFQVGVQINENNVPAFELRGIQRAPAKNPEAHRADSFDTHWKQLPKPPQGA